MFGFLKNDRKIDVPKTIDIIENAVYDRLKPHGFKKHGRTLHRFVSEDISQVIHFQSGVRGLEGLLCVNVGIRVPECAERVFHAPNDRKYYHEYECTIRSRLGQVKSHKEKWYDLHKPAEKITADIMAQLDKIVLPAFDVLSSREAILAHRRVYPWLYSFGSELLDECMIHGHLGNLEKAKEIFERYYESAVAEYEDQAKNGRKMYLKKGERVVYMGQDITAKRNGYVTLYGANHSHIEYLDELAVTLGFR